MTLTPRQVAALVLARGFADPVRATAVVLGESGGNPGAVGRNSDGSEDVGLWQINTRWHINPGNITRAQAEDVRAATDYAFSISDGGRDFRLWNATRQGTFAGHLRTAEQAVNEARGDVQADDGRAWYERITVIPGVPAILPGIPGLPGVDIPNPLDAAGAAVDATKQAAGIIARIGAALLDPGFWRRVGLGLLGLIVIFAGWSVFNRDRAMQVLGLVGPGKAAAAVKAGQTANAVPAAVAAA